MTNKDGMLSNEVNYATGSLKNPSFSCACRDCFNGLILSNTLETFSFSQPGMAAWLRMLDVCDKEGFDLDDFIFEIWKDTYNV